MAVPGLQIDWVWMQAFSGPLSPDPVLKKGGLTSQGVGKLVGQSALGGMAAPKACGRRRKCR